MTIRGIAELAGVAKSTVSKALNGHPDVGPETRARILELVRSLGYVPDASARAVATGRTGTIGIIIPMKPGPVIQGRYWSAVVGAAATSAAHYGQDLLMLVPREEGEVVSAYPAMLNSRKVDGVIIGSEVLHEHDVDPLTEADIPFVLLGTNPWVPHYSIGTDNRGGARAMTRHLAELGYERIGILAGSGDFPYVADRIEGWREALRERGLREGPVVTEQGTEEDIRGAADTIVDADADAIFVAAGNEAMISVLRRLRERGVADELGLGVFDDDPVFDLIEPKVSAVVQPLEEIGVRAVDVLLRIMDGVGPVTKEVVLPTTLNARALPKART